MKELRIAIDINVGLSENTEKLLNTFIPAIIERSSKPATTIELPAQADPAPKPDNGAKNEEKPARKPRTHKSKDEEEPEKDKSNKQLEDEEAHNSQKELNPAPEEKPAEQEPAKEEPPITLEELRKQFKEKVDEGGASVREKIKEKLTSIGVEKLPELPVDKIGVMYEFLKTL